MILYMILDRETREPVRTRRGITYRAYNSPRDASIALSSLAEGYITPEKRDSLEEKYVIVSFDTNRLPRALDNEDGVE